MYPEPGVESYLDTVLRTGVRCVKVHVQVGGFDPRSPLLDKAWGMIAEAGLPEIGFALDLAARYPGVHLDTTMVGVDIAGGREGLPADWVARLVDAADRIVLGTDFPSIPYPYAEQIAAIAGWARPTTGWASRSCGPCCTTHRRGCSASPTRHRVGRS